jgi:tyrosyl-tRNA synthetase
VNKLQTAGAEPIIITGGATSKIGDPTWKDKERVMLAREEVSENIESIMKKLRELIKFDNDVHSAGIACPADIVCPAISLDNDDWISKINYMEFLRDFGPLFSVNKMLTMDSVSARLKRRQHLSFLEFNYMLLQAYDFLYLFENHNCVLQIGGADQWANMIFGVDLIRRKTGKTAFGMSMPLLETSDGKKMGKTEKGTVWLDESLTPPFEFWQYWRNVDDKDVTKLLKLFSDLDDDEINSYESLVGRKEINDIKILLADAITSFVHPSADLEAIKSTARTLFAGASEHLDNVETFYIDKPTRIDRVLVDTKLAESLTAARRLIDGRGVKVDKRAMENYDEIISNERIISVGKKRFVKVVVE